MPLPMMFYATASNVPLPVIFRATVSDVLCHCQRFSMPLSVFYATARDFPCHCQQSFMHFLYGTELMSLLLWLKMSH